MMIGIAGAFAMSGVQQNPGAQECGCQNPIGQMIQRILQTVKHLLGGGGHCSCNQNPNFGNGPFAQASAGGGPGLSGGLALQDPFGGGLAASHAAGPGGLAHSLAIKDPFGGGIALAGAAGPDGVSHGLSIKLPFGGPSLSLSGAVGNPLKGLLG